MSVQMQENLMKLLHQLGKTMDGEISYYLGLSIESMTSPDDKTKIIPSWGILYVQEHVAHLMRMQYCTW